MNDFMRNMMQCRAHASCVLASLQGELADVPANTGGHFAFRVPVGAGHSVSVSVPPDANSSGQLEVVETLVFDEDGKSVYDLPDELGYDDDVRRFWMEGGQLQIQPIAAHIKALREHFGQGEAGGASNQDLDSNSDSNSDSDLEPCPWCGLDDPDEDVRKVIERKCKNIMKRIGVLDEKIRIKMAEAARHREELAKKNMKDINQHTTKEGNKTREAIREVLRDFTDTIKTQISGLLDNTRAICERVRAMEELVNAQQKQMSEMSQKIALLEAKTNR